MRERRAVVAAVTQIYISRKRQTEREWKKNKKHILFFSSFHFSIDGKTAGIGKKKKFFFFLILHWVSLSFFFWSRLFFFSHFIEASSSKEEEEKKKYIDITTVQSYRCMPSCIWQKTVTLLTLERRRSRRKNIYDDDDSFFFLKVRTKEGSYF